MRRRLIIFGVLICRLTSLAEASIPNELLDSISQCGINALYSCMHYLGVEVPLDQLYSDLPRNENNEVNLYQLAQYARNCGLHVRPIKHPTLPLLKKYLTSSSSAILQFKYPNGEGHIVALLRPDSDDIWVLDAPSDKFIPPDELLRHSLEQSEAILIVSAVPVGRSIFGHINTSGSIWVPVALTSMAIFVITILSSTIKRKRREYV